MVRHGRLDRRRLLPAVAPEEVVHDDVVDVADLRVRLRAVWLGQGGKFGLEWGVQVISEEVLRSESINCAENANILMFSRPDKSGVS